MARATDDSFTSIEHRNDVTVVGRVSSPALSRDMPSGDVLTTWRVVVDRPEALKRRDDGRGQDFDVIDCVTSNGRVRQSASRWVVGDVVEVRGGLRKRYWRSNGVLQSRCELEAAKVVRVARVDAAIRRPRKTG